MEGSVEQDASLCFWHAAPPPGRYMEWGAEACFVVPTHPEYCHLLIDLYVQSLQKGFGAA